MSNEWVERLEDHLPAARKAAARAAARAGGEYLLPHDKVTLARQTTREREREAARRRRRHEEMARKLELAIRTPGQPRLPRVKLEVVRLALMTLPSAVCDLSPRDVIGALIDRSRTERPVITALRRRALQTKAPEDIRRLMTARHVETTFCDNGSDDAWHANVQAHTDGQIGESWFSSTSGELESPKVWRALGTRERSARSPHRVGLRFKAGQIPTDAWDGTIYEPTHKFVECKPTQSENGDREQNRMANMVDRGISTDRVFMGVSDTDYLILKASIFDGRTYEQIGYEFGSCRSATRATIAGRRLVRMALRNWEQLGQVLTREEKSKNLHERFSDPHAAPCK